MFKSTGLAKMFAGRRKFFRGPHVRHLCSRQISPLRNFVTYESKFVLVTSELCLLRFGVNFCKSYDFF